MPHAGLRLLLATFLAPLNGRADELPAHICFLQRQFGATLRPRQPANATTAWLARSEPPGGDDLDAAELLWAPAPSEALVSRQSGNVPQQRPDPKPGPTNTDPQTTAFLNAHRPQDINLWTGMLLSGITAMGLTGFCIDRQRWVALMVLSSYAILIPGLGSKDFSMNIALTPQAYLRSLPIVKILDPFGVLVGGLPARIQITSKDGVPGPLRESTRSMVPFLWDTGSKTGAVLIAIFAFVVPVAKLMLLGLAEVWRRQGSASHIRLARWSILFVQIISKWASPDMFAFSLLYYLFRDLNNPPLVESLQVFDIGFSCYCIFCVSSVVSTLFIRLPELPEDSKTDMTQPMVLRFLGRFGFLFLVMCLTIAWALLFIHGLHMPVLTIRLDPDTLIEAGGLPESLGPLVKNLNLESMINSDVRIWQCGMALKNWFADSWELTLFIGAVMILVFVIALTVLDMVMLLSAAIWALGSPWEQALAASSATGHEELDSETPRRTWCLAMEVSSVVKHIAMMDVCLTGVLVISFAAEFYKEDGIFINVVDGTWVLLGAEVIHYVTYYVVSGCVAAVAAGSK